MPASKKPKKKFFTVEEANKMLPLVTAILKDIVPLAENLMERQERLGRHRRPAQGERSDFYSEEFDHAQLELAKDAARLEEYVDELRRLGVELKGLEGLVDFPGWMDGREVCLCWKLGEPEVAHWHETDAGFGGRKRLPEEEAVSPSFTVAPSQN